MTSVCRSQCCRCCWCCCPRGCVQTANIANIATTAITTISQDLGDLSWPRLPQCSLSLHRPPSILPPTTSGRDSGDDSGTRASGTGEQEGRSPGVKMALTRDTWPEYRERPRTLAALFRGSMPMPGPGSVSGESSGGNPCIQ